MKTKHLKNLRVAVVPSETGNGIDQSSMLEEVLACEETVIYSLTDYFQAQNNEDIDLLHWSFLYDKEANIELTGVNIDGVHQFDRESDISIIQRIIKEHGEFTATEIELDASPIKNSMGNGHINVSELVEGFRFNGVETITYHDEHELGYDWYDYTDVELSDDLIAEIKVIAENYEADCLKTEKRCAD